MERESFLSLGFLSPNLYLSCSFLLSSPFNGSLPRAFFSSIKDWQIVGVTIGIGLVRIGNKDWIKDWVRIGNTFLCFFWKSLSTASF